MHIDSNSDIVCDICNLNLPFFEFTENKEIKSSIVSGEEIISNNKLTISGNMPKDIKAIIDEIEKTEAIKLAKQHMKDLTDEDIHYAYDISLNTNSNKFQPADYNQSVKVKISDLNLDTSKTYAMLHIKDDGTSEILPINKLTKNEIEFIATSFSTYMVITVGTNSITFDGENFKVYDTEGNEITNDATVASGTNFNFVIMPNNGYGVTDITCVNSAGESVIATSGSIRAKGGLIASVTEDLTVYVTTVLAPKITTQPVSVKVTQSNTAKFTIAATGTNLTYQWQYRENENTYWKNVSSTLGSNYTTATFSLTNTPYEVSGWEFRCLVGDANFTNHERISSDIAKVAITIGEVKVGEAPIILEQPTMDLSKVKANSGKAEFKVTALGSDLTFTWQYRENKNDYWKKITSSSIGSASTTTIDSSTTNPIKSSTLKTATALYSMLGYEYRCLVGNSFYSDHDAVKSDVVTIVISDGDLNNQVKHLNLNIIKHPESQKVELGKSATFTIKTEGVNKYQWKYKSSGDGFWKNCDNTMSTGYNTATLIVNTSTMDINEEDLSVTNNISGYQFKCVVSNSSVATYTKDSDIAMLSVAKGEETASVVYTSITHPQDVTVEEGNDATFTAGMTPVDDNVTYEWHEVIDDRDINLVTQDALYKSNNRGEPNTTATEKIIIKASANATVSFDYMVSSEANNDTFTVTIEDANGITTAVNGISGITNWANYTGQFNPNAAGNIILNLTYSKNASINGGEDFGAIKNLKCTSEKYIDSLCTYVSDDVYTLTNPDTSSYSTAKVWEATTIDGVLTFQSTNAGVNSSYSVATILMTDVPTGANLSFEYRVSSESATYDYLQTYLTDVDGKNQILKIGGTGSVENWNTYNKTVTPDSSGNVTLTFIYRKDGSVNKGDDLAAIRNLKINAKRIILVDSTYENDDVFTFENNFSKLEYIGADTGTLTVPGDLVSLSKNGAKYYLKIGETKTNMATLTVIPGSPFVTEWTIPANADSDGSGTTIKLPIPGHTMNNYTVDWGDGVVEYYDSNANFPTHEYKNTAETKYTISVAGAVYEFGHCSGATPDLTNEYSDYYTACQYITGLKQWGEIEARRYGFSGCINLSGTIPAPTENSMKNLTNAAVLFRNCPKLQGTIPENLFEGATAVEDFGSVFEFCRGLTGAIPENLFATNVNAKVFTSAFRDTGLSGTIPSGLFANNKKATTFSYTFADNNNLTTIGKGLFNANTEVTDFGSTFENCKGLTSIPNGLFAGKSKATNFRTVFFTCNGITSAIPGDLFDGCTAAESFELAFANCSKISGNIPETLFEDSPNVKTFSGLFEGCTGLTGDIPAGLFKNNTKVENLRTVFFNCTGLTGGEVLLDTSNVTNADYMFWNCSNMTTLILGENFKKLDAEGQFGVCNKLKAIIMLNDAKATSDVATLGALSTINLPDTTIIYVPTSEAESIYESAWSNKIAADRVEPMIKLIGEDKVVLPEEIVAYVEDGYTVAGYDMSRAAEYEKYGYEVTISDSDPIDSVGSFVRTYTLTREVEGVTKTIDKVERTIYVNIKMEVTILSTNDSKQYAKIGDSINVIMTTTKELGVIPQVTIAGKTATISPSEAGATRYVATVVVDNTYVEGEAPIYITGYEDELGNKGKDISSTTDNSVVYIDRTAPSTDAPELISKTENTIKVQNKQQDNMSAVFNSGIVKVEYTVKESSSSSAWRAYQLSDTLAELKVGTAYDIKTIVTDAAGNVSESKILSNIVTDSVVSGDIKFTTSTNEWTNQDVEVTIIWPATTLDKYYRVNDGEWISTSDTNTIVLATEYEDVITAKLVNGNVNEITNSIMISNIDKKKPEVTATVPNGWTNTGKTITANGSDNEDGSGIAGYYITTDSGYVPVKANFVASTSSTYTFVKPMGTYYIWVIDAAGNVSGAPYVIAVENVETQKPVITYVNANVASANKDDVIEITFKATDNNTGLTSTLKEADIRVFVGETVVGPTSIVLTTTNNGDEILYTLTITGMTGNGKLSIEVAENKVKDIAGNVNDTTKLETPIIIDNQGPEKPTVTVEPDGDVVNETVTITIDEKPGEKYEYSTDDGKTWEEVPEGGVIINKEGETEVLIRAEDEAGNKSEPTEVTVNIDSENPILGEPDIILPTDDNGQEKENAKDGDEVIIEIPVDDDSDVTVDDGKIKVTIGGEEITTEDIEIIRDPDTNKPVITITIPAPSDKEGEIVVELENGAVTDEAGNPSDGKVADTGVIVDNTKPEIAITSPGGEHKAGDEITYIIEITEENPYDINEDKIVVTGGTIGNIDTSTPGKIIVNVIVGDGNGEIIFKAEEGLIKDNAGNESETKSDNSVIADNKAPVINGATINNGATTTTEVGVTVQIDATNADWMFVTNDDKSLADVMGLPEGPNGWVPFADETLHELTQGDGEKTVYVWVKDNAGNITGPKEIKITLKATTIGNKEDKEVVNGTETKTSNGTNSTTIKFKVSDLNFYSSTVFENNISAFVNNSECTTAKFTNIQGQATTNGTVYEVVIGDVSGNGKLAIGLENAIVKDKAGNVLATTTTPVTTEITVDNTAPTLTVTSSAITVSDTNLVGVMLNGKLIRTTNGTTNITVPAGSIVKAIDKAGNTTTVSK